MRSMDGTKNSANTGSDADLMLQSRVKVLFPLPLFKPYDYLHAGGELSPGSFVSAPFGPRDVIGIVWPGESDEIAQSKLKSISAVIEAPPLQEDLIDFINWVADYTMFPIGSVVRMVMRSGDFLKKPAMQSAFILEMASRPN